MLHTRLLMGTILVALGFAVLILDEWFTPYYPAWLIVIVGLGLVTCYELVHISRVIHPIPYWLAAVGVVGILAANWIPHLPATESLVLGPWSCILTAYMVYMLMLFIKEMATFERPGGVIARIALLLFIASYLAVLPSFVIQLRWPIPVSSSQVGTVALVMAIFVPKCCDIGAFFAGRWLGRTRMTPLLSPKKTWEGAVGGLILAIIITFAIDRLAPVSLLGQLWWAEIGFGITVGGAGILGDLAESMIKRDYQQKDASQVVPGFGGVLDVIDAVLFSAPVSFFWFVALNPEFQFR